jgi:hypothetical protein
MKIHLRVLASYSERGCSKQAKICEEGYEKTHMRNNKEMKE